MLVKTMRLRFKKYFPLFTPANQGINQEIKNELANLRYFEKRNLPFEHCGL